MGELPKINWIKNDKEIHQLFEDGSAFLVALQVTDNKTKITKWMFDCIRVACDGDWFVMEYLGGETYDAREWSDFEYFHVLDGHAPEPKHPYSSVTRYCP